MDHSASTPLRAGIAALALLAAACNGNDDPGIQTTDDTSTGATTEVDGTSTDPTEGPGPGCGDGVLDDGEACDDGADNGEDRACLPTCEQARCGDGFVGPGEGCDDGNLLDNDGCTSTCALPGCGDGVQSAGEACDDGNDLNSDGCLNTCQLASCGDNYVREGLELCDDGNDLNSDDCLASCQPAKCGDGYVHDVDEQCDDGDSDNSNGCLSTCVLATCGDGYVEEGVEACDDGNDVDDDECLTDCSKPATCEDGVQNGSEADVDCGGQKCVGCLDDQACSDGVDCFSGFCKGSQCVTPRHCKDLRDLGLADADGVYIVDPDGQTGPAHPVSVFCEMTFNGGGWTAVFNMREKPIGEASAQQMFDAITKNGTIEPVLPNSNSPAILTQGLVLSDFNEVVFGWAPSLLSDVARYGKLTDPDGLDGTCYLDGFCGPGKVVGEFDIVPTGNTRTLQTGKPTDFPHVGLGFDDQIIVWGYDRNASHFSNWANWYDEGVCCKAGNTEAINTPGWRYTIYVR